MRWPLIALLTLAACRHTSAPASKPAPIGPAIATATPVASSSAGLEETAFLEPVALPGCTKAVAAETRERFKRIDEPLKRELGAVTSRDDELPALLTELDAMWASPCLAHVTRFFPRPHVESFGELQLLWYRGHLSAMVAMIGGLYRRDGKRIVVVPPASRGPLDADARKALAPWICEPTRTDCGNSGSFIARTESAFDAEELRHATWQSEHGWEACKDAAARDDREPKPTAFESWMLCVGGELPRTQRYTRSVRLRAPDHGWLVLRGRRGHYAFADEVRAYDLATGAAYVARSESALVLAGPEVDFGAVDKQRKPDAFTGNVLAETVRELAFVVLTAAALAPARPTMTWVPVPEGMPITLSERFSHRVGESLWGTSAQTTLSFTIIDGTKLVAEGSFTYPDSAYPHEQRADDVLAVLEAGLERGCPRAQLPTRLGRSASSGASSLDADPARQVGVSLDLDRALDGLRTQPCKR